MSSCTLFLKAVTFDSWSMLHSLCTTVALYGCKCNSFFFASYTDNVDTPFTLQVKPMISSEMSPT